MNGPQWLTEKWFMMTEKQRDRWCEHRTWDEMDLWQREHCCIRQKLSITFIDAKWAEMDKWHKNGCCRHQKLSVRFISKHWAEMTDGQRDLCCEYQNYLKYLPMEQLPQYLVSNNTRIRARAVEALGTIRKE